jgi:hypothetical protein
MPLKQQANQKVWIWDEASKAALKELDAEGLSGAEMADKLSEKFGTPITRNAVIGARHRWSLHSSERKVRPPRVKKVHRSPIQPQRRRKNGTQVPRPPLTYAIPFVDRAPGQCSFPVDGAGINMLCCGAKRYQYGGWGGIKHTRFPYCHYHCNVAYRWRSDDTGPYLGNAAG